MTEKDHFRGTTVRNLHVDENADRKRDGRVTRQW